MVQQSNILNTINYSVLPYLITGLGSFFLVATLSYVIYSMLTFFKARWNERSFQRTSERVHHIVERGIDDRHRSEKLAFNEHLCKIHCYKTPILTHRQTAIHSLRISTTHPIFTHFTSTIYLDNYSNSMLKFEQLLYEKQFLLDFIWCLEKYGDTRDKFEMSSFLVASLIDTMEYLIDVLKDMLKVHINRVIKTDHPEKLFLTVSTEPNDQSVTEHLLNIILTISMYDYCAKYLSQPLYELYHAIKFCVERGPIDAMTHDSYYTIFPSRLIQTDIHFNSIILRVIDDNGNMFECTVLDCDTIEQVKQKIIDKKYENVSYSQRPLVQNYELGWFDNDNNQKPHFMFDVDKTSVQINGWRKLNTLSHYNVPAYARVKLIPKWEIDEETLNKIDSECLFSNMSTSSLHTTISKESESNLSTKSSDTSWTSQKHAVQNKMYNLVMRRIYHFVKPVDGLIFVGRLEECKHKKDIKNISENKLVNLLTMKRTLQPFIDRLISVILAVTETDIVATSSLYTDSNLSAAGDCKEKSIKPPPMLIEWLIEFFNAEIKKHKITNTKLAYKWKCESIIKFWSFLITNPDILLDIKLTHEIRLCLSVIGQEFYYSALKKRPFKRDCTTQRLISQNNIECNHEKVKNYFQTINEQQLTKESVHKELFESIEPISELFKNSFDSITALKELYFYVTKYRSMLMEIFNSDPAKKQYRYKLLSVSLPSGNEDFTENMTDKEIVDKLLNLTNSKLKKGKRGKKNIIEPIDDIIDYNDDLDDIFPNDAD